MGARLGVPACTPPFLSLGALVRSTRRLSSAPCGGPSAPAYTSPPVGRAGRARPAASARASPITQSFHSSRFGRRQSFAILGIAMRNARSFQPPVSREISLHCDGDPPSANLQSSPTRNAEKMHKRRPHPIACRHQLAENRTKICEARGYCGPFINHQVYNAMPGWVGLADCLTCGSTVSTAPHEELRRRREEHSAIGRPMYDA